MKATTKVSLPRRVVVTGLGAITPLGTTINETWDALLQQQSGMTTLEKALTDYQGLSDDALDREISIAKTLPCQVVAPVKLKLENDARTARFVQMALLAGAEAMQNAKLEPSKWQINTDNSHDDISELQRERFGVCIGSGMSSVREISNAVSTLQEKGQRRLSPHFVPKVLSNSAAGRLSLEYGLHGPNHSASTACAAGSHSIGDAFRCIQHDNADIMLAGGAESCIDPLSMAGFCRLRALSTNFNDNPSLASRPFDKQRDGFVMGEGAAVLVLEELNHAIQRQAPIFAEITGYGLSGDGYHITAPDPIGKGAERAMTMALQQGGTTKLDDIGYVNAHATSTPKGDEIEASVIDRIIQNNNNRTEASTLYVSSVKGATGHLLGAAGALEACVTVLSITNQTIPPTQNLSSVDDDCNKDGFQHVIETPIQASIQAAINNSFGFGGTNASIIFRKYTVG